MTTRSLYWLLCAPLVAGYGTTIVSTVSYCPAPPTLASGSGISPPSPSASTVPVLLTISTTSPGQNGKRQAIGATEYIQPDGRLSTQCVRGASFQLNGGRLFADGLEISANSGDSFVPFKGSSTPGSIDTTFALDNAILTWSNAAFPAGTATFCQLNGTVIASFTVAPPAGCLPVVVGSTPVTTCPGYPGSGSSGPDTSASVTNAVTNNTLTPAPTPGPSQASYLSYYYSNGQSYSTLVPVPTFTPSNTPPGLQTSAYVSDGVTYYTLIPPPTPGPSQASYLSYYYSDGQSYSTLVPVPTFTPSNTLPGPSGASSSLATNTGLGSPNATTSTGSGISPPTSSSLCPDFNHQIDNIGGVDYEIECATDFLGTNIVGQTTKTASDLAGCIFYCNQYNTELGGCIGVTFNTESDYLNCYLYQDISTNYYRSNINAARLIYSAYTAITDAQQTSFPVVTGAATPSISATITGSANSNAATGFTASGSASTSSASTGSNPTDTVATGTAVTGTAATGTTGTGTAATDTATTGTATTGTAATGTATTGTATTGTATTGTAATDTATTGTATTGTATTGTATTATSTSTPTSTVAPQNLCSSSGQSFSGSQYVSGPQGAGAVYDIECGVDFRGGNSGSQDYPKPPSTAASFQDCAVLCDKQNDYTFTKQTTLTCGAIVYNTNAATQNCYLITEVSLLSSSDPTDRGHINNDGYGTQTTGYTSGIILFGARWGDNFQANDGTKSDISKPDFSRLKLSQPTPITVKSFYDGLNSNLDSVPVKTFPDAFAFNGIITNSLYLSWSGFIGFATGANPAPLKNQANAAGSNPAALNPGLTSLPASNLPFNCLVPFWSAPGTIELSSQYGIYYQIDGSVYSFEFYYSRPDSNQDHPYQFIVTYDTSVANAGIWTVYFFKTGTADNDAFSEGKVCTSGFQVQNALNTAPTVPLGITTLSGTAYAPPGTKFVINTNPLLYKFQSTTFGFASVADGTWKGTDTHT